LPNYLVSKIKGLPLVYDSHEYFTGVPEIQNRPFVKWVWKTIEKWIFPGLTYVITVSDKIAELYEDSYKIKPLVIRNLSKRSDAIVPYSKIELGIEESDILLIIQGSGINVDKGSEELIEAVRDSSGVSLLVVGGGDVLSELKRRTIELNIGNKIMFFPSTTWEKLMKFTKAADIGMCLEKDTNINYRYSLPNKLFDYISAGIPVIAGQLPETGKLISEYNCGLIIAGITPMEISLAINKLMRNRELFSNLKENSIAASGLLNWETESEIVKKFYKEVLGRNGKTV
jgi:glycosyltransferase involved in cell wall biosynthesis